MAAAAASYRSRYQRLVEESRRGHSAWHRRMISNSDHCGAHPRSPSTNPYWLFAQSLRLHSVPGTLHWNIINRQWKHRFKLMANHELTIWKICLTGATVMNTITPNTNDTIAFYCAGELWLNRESGYLTIRRPLCDSVPHILTMKPSAERSRRWQIVTSLMTGSISSSDCTVASGYDDARSTIEWLFNIQFVDLSWLTRQAEINVIDDAFSNWFFKLTKDAKR